MILYVQTFIVQMSKPILRVQITLEGGSVRGVSHNVKGFLVLFMKISRVKSGNLTPLLEKFYCICFIKASLTYFHFQNLAKGDLLETYVINKNSFSQYGDSFLLNIYNKRTKEKHIYPMNILKQLPIYYNFSNF